MKVLVINGHPDSESYISTLFNAYHHKVDLSKHEVKILELGKINFDPVLRFGYRKIMDNDHEMALSRDYLKWADHIVLFFPIWFETVPSLLKGWFDRTLVPGFAFNMEGYKVTKYFKGKTAHLVFTSLAPKIYQKIRGDIERKTVTRLLSFCGIKTIKIDRLAGIKANKNKRGAFIKIIEKRALSLK